MKVTLSKLSCPDHIQCEKSIKTTNSGVCVKGSYASDYDHNFYGILLDIIELEYLISVISCAI